MKATEARELNRYARWKKANPARTHINKCIIKEAKKPDGKNLIEVFHGQLCNNNRSTMNALIEELRNDGYRVIEKDHSKEKTPDERVANRYSLVIAWS